MTTSFHTDEVARLTQVVHKIDPAARLLAAWQLKGGISAQMTALEVALANGERRKLIVRRPGSRALQSNPQAARDEFRILEFVQAIGVKTQRPYLLDESGEIFPQPYLVIEYIEGEPLYAPPDTTRYTVQMAEQLAQLHRAGLALLNASLPDASRPDLSFLPRQAQRLTGKLQARSAALDHSLEEGRIRDLLEEVWPLPSLPGDTLLHGDFWPGNLLWRDGKLVAVIDWEDAEIGNPLADFAITRLDLLWILGREAMHTFTQRYQALTRFDFGQLPYWDLFAALRPASRLAEWAAGWAELGRSDITEATMRAGHRWFVAQAFEKLAR